MKRSVGSEDFYLAACPFCGLDAADFTDCQELQACETWRKCPVESRYVAVVCSFYRGGCGASTGFYPNAATAALKWNHRMHGLGLEKG